MKELCIRWVEKRFGFFIRSQFVPFSLLGLFNIVDNLG